MIEKRIKNELNRRRWRRLKEQKRSVIAFFILIVVCFFSYTAPMWSNSKPLYLSFKGKSYFPVVKDYHPDEFGQQDRLVTDYRTLEIAAEDKIIWPVIPWDPFESNKSVAQYPSEPTHDNWFGTDDRGRDVFSRLLYGFQYSMSYAIFVWFLTTVIGILLGGAMGYFGGLVDLVGQRVVEVMSTVPVLFLIIILVSIFKPNIYLLVVITSIFGWILISYYVRAEFLKNRKMDFVEAARALGAGNLRIMLRHILPNSLTPIITFTPFIIAAEIYGLAALDYLGFGLTPPTPSWGELLNQAQKQFTVAWWLAVFPSAALFFTLVLMGMIGDGLRVALDPKKS